MSSNLSKQVWSAILTVEIVMLLALALSFPHLEPGTATYVVALLSTGVILVTMAILAVIIYVGWEPF